MSGEIERGGYPVAPTDAQIREQSAWLAETGRTRTRGGTMHGPGYPSARKVGELDPEWVMVGVDVPAGKRLYASKDLKGSAFEAAMDEHWNGDGWHLTTTMQRMLIITRPTYGECLAELQRIWANWANEGRELPAGGGSSMVAATGRGGNDSVPQTAGGGAGGAG